MSESETQNQSRRTRRAQTKADTTGEIRDRNQKLRTDAAQKRRKARKQALAEAQGEGLDAGERVDDALTRGAHATGQFLRSHFSWLQWLIVAGIAGSMAFLVYDYRQEKARQKRGQELAEALAVVSGRIASAETTPPADRNLVDTRPEFASEEEQLAAAAKEFAELSKSSSPELALIGKLGRASVLYDQKKFAEAREAYDQVFANPVAVRFPELKARAQEGIVLAFEAESRLDDALKAALTLKDLGSSYADLGRFHEARIKYSQGDLPFAKDALEKLVEKLEKKRAPDDSPAYLEAAALDLLKTVDPARAAEPEGMTREQLEALQRQLQELQAKMGESTPEAPPLEVPGPPSEGSAPAPAETAPPEAPPAAPAPAAPAPPPAPTPPAAPSTPPVPTEGSAQ